jgi:hypothetical protein
MSQLQRVCLVFFVAITPVLYTEQWLTAPPHLKYVFFAIYLVLALGVIAND